MPKEVKQWITVKGNRVPIFEGESKEDAIKRMVNKQGETKKTSEKKAPTRKQLEKVPKHVTGKNASELHKNLEEQGLGMDSADASSLHHRDFNDEKVSLYDAYGNEYRGTFNKYSDGGMEVVNIKKEWYNRKPTDIHSTGVKEKTETQKQISKDNDEKAKQIARNKKEADERSEGKSKKTSVPERVDTYIKPEHKVSPAKLKKEIDDYPIGTYIKYAIKGNINDISGTTYGKVKTGDNEWTSYSSLVGYGDKKSSSQDIKNFIYSKGVKNIGVKTPQSEQSKTKASAKAKSKSQAKSLVQESSRALKTYYSIVKDLKEKKKIGAELNTRGWYYKDGKWTSKGGGR